MSYEVKMFIGEIGSMNTKDGSPLLTIAMVDLCSPGGSDVKRLAEAKVSDEFKPAYLYSFDEGERVTEDRYGKQLAIINPQTVLDTLKKVNKSHPYRRYTIAIATLEAIIADFTIERIGIVFYGY
jgi:hypothetical protein